MLMSELSLKNLRFINILLVISIIAATLILLRNLLFFGLSDKGLPPSQLQKIDTGRILKKKSLMHYSEITEKNPFGPPSKLEPLGPSVHETKAVTRPVSSLVLIGTAVGTDNIGYAIFEDKAALPSVVQDVFAIGEEVFSYGKLVSISGTYVKVRQGSELLTVEMPEDHITTDTEISMPEPVHKASKNSFAKKIGDKDYLLDRFKVQQSLEDPEKILTDARLLPSFKDGRQQGFIISEVVPDGLYHSIGLRDGDILLRINGLKISNPEVAIQAMSAIRGMNRVSLDIIRNNENMSLNYQIR